MNPLKPEDQDSKDRLAELAESFDSQLREHGEAVWPSEVDGERIPSLLELIHATLRPGSTRSAGPDEESDLAFIVPPQVGRFKVGEEVGRGGFGVVYRAYDELLHRDVAIKAIPRRTGLQSAGDDHRLREARAVARLNHPNLVPLYEVLNDDHCVYLISEFCEGPTLSQYLREVGGPLEPRQAGEITLRIAQAIAHAHDRGLVHRDIKPSNVLLMTERVDADLLPFTPRLTDFGLVLETSGTTPTQFPSRLVGTVNFMSPEQILGDDRWDARSSDIYSLGLLLYRMLAGRSPYRASSPMELIEEICSKSAASLPQLVPPIPVDLVAICQKAIQKEPVDRYATARDLVNDLLRWREGRAVSARRQSIPERVLRSIRREPVVASLITAFVFLAIISSVTFAWSNRLLRQQGVALEDAFRLASLNESKAIEAAYFSDITQAYSAVAKDDASTARSILSRINSYIGDDRRDRFDLRLLRSLAQRGWSEVARLDGEIEEVVYVPKLKGFAVASETSGVHFVREADGKMIGRHPLSGNDKLKALAVAPDGHHMALGISTTRTFPWGWTLGTQSVEVVSFDELGNVTVDPTTQVRASFPTVRTWSGFDATVESLAYSNDGKLLAVGARYEPLQILNVNSGDERITLPNERRNEDLSFSQSGELAWMTTKTTISIRDAGLEKEIRQITIPTPRELRRVRRSPDGRWIATALHHVAEAFLYTPSDISDEPVVLENVGGELRALSFSPNSHYLAVGSSGGCVAVWDLRRLETQLLEQRLQKIPAEGKTIDAAAHLRVSAERLYSIHDTPVTSLAVSDDGTILSGGHDGALTLIRGASPEPTNRVLNVPVISRCACATSDGRTIYVGGQNGSVWAIDTDTNHSTQLHDVSDLPITRIAISPDNRWLVAGSQDGHAMIRERSSSGAWSSLPYTPPDNDSPTFVVGIEFNASSTGILITRGGSQAQWIDLEPATGGDQTLRVQERYCYHAPTSIHVNSILADNTVMTFSDVYYRLGHDAGASPLSMDGSHDIHVGCFDPHHQTTILGTNDGRLRIVDREGKLLRESLRWKPFESDAEEVRKITAITLSPGGENILTGSELGDIGIWDTETLRYLGTLFSSIYDGAIDMIRVSSDGEKLLAHQYLIESSDAPIFGSLHKISIP